VLDSEFAVTAAAITEPYPFLHRFWHSPSAESQNRDCLLKKPWRHRADYAVGSFDQERRNPRAKRLFLTKSSRSQAPNKACPTELSQELRPSLNVAKCGRGRPHSFYVFLSSGDTQAVFDAPDLVKSQHGRLSQLLDIKRRDAASQLDHTVRHLALDTTQRCIASFEKDSIHIFANRTVLGPQARMRDLTHWKQGMKRKVVRMNERKPLVVISRREDCRASPMPGQNLASKSRGIGRSASQLASQRPGSGVVGR
jgi:hypothetical protein